MRRSVRAAAGLILIVCLAGCSPKEMDLMAFSPDIAAAAQSEGIALEVDIPLVLTLTPPDDSFSLDVTASDPALEASLDGDRLTLTGRRAGNFLLVCDLEADGYRSRALELPVSVALRRMALSAGGGESGAPAENGGTLSLARGDGAVFPLVAEQGATLSCRAGNPDIATACVAQGSLLVDALYPGQTDITVTAQKEGYEPAVLSFSVTVTPTRAALTLSSGSLSLIRGVPADLPIAFEPGGTLSAVDPPQGVSVLPAAGGLRITADASGLYQVRVRCEAEAFDPAEKLLTLTVSDPAIVLRLSENLSLATGETKKLAVSVSPPDAALTLSPSGGIAATLSETSIAVEASSAGAARLTVTASREGYQSATATVEIAVTAPPLRSPYSDVVDEIVALTNRERKDAGLSPLAHIAALDAPATLRAQEAAKYWSHTRPDGSDFYTVLGEYGLSYRGKGENLFSANLLDAALAVENWMASYSHRENILLPDFTGIGVGVIKSSDGFYYYSQFFVHD
jgi:uncharacterized protein YkwD